MSTCSSPRLGRVEGKHNHLSAVYMQRILAIRYTTCVHVVCMCRTFPVLLPTALSKYNDVIMTSLYIGEKPVIVKFYPNPIRTLIMMVGIPCIHGNSS